MTGGADRGTGATSGHEDPIAVRRTKVAALRAAGIEPYPAGWPWEADRVRVASVASAHADLHAGATTEDVVAVAGRMVAKREQGKVVFLVLRDDTGEIQLFCRVGALDEEDFRRVTDLDVGDWIAARGSVMRTRRGELSVEPAEVVLLSKSLRPLPEKWHGLTDTETRYRQRYVDLVANPEVRRVFEARFRVVSSVRGFMGSRGFAEVETPMLQPIPGGAAAKPFVTHHKALGIDLYLRIAPELYLKRLLVGGFERVYEINRSFRNEGMSPRHNPEFTMLEAYQAFADMESMMELTESLISHVASETLGSLTFDYQGTAISLEPPWRRAAMEDLVTGACGRTVSVHSGAEDLRALCATHDVPTEGSWGPGKLVNELFEKLVEPSLTQPTLVTRYPAETSPLARRCDDDPELTDRFELIIAGREIANAFSELADPEDQRRRFETQASAKAAGDEEAMWVDEDYLRAQEYGMPPAGGLGVGIDRLVMLLTDSASIRDVLLFPHMRPEA